MEREKEVKRVFAIPDIHGRSDLLARLIAKLTNEEKMDLENDTLIFLGDMIDRGPDSRGVVAAIRGIQELAPKNVVVLAGNHEWLAINTYMRARIEDRQLWYYNGGLQTIASYDGDIPEETVKWMADLPLSHEQDGFFFSHAPVPKELYRRAANQGQLYTMNELTWTYFGEGDEAGCVGHPTMTGVCGHIHRLQQGVMEPRLYPHYIFADAGAGCSPAAPLVAIEVKSRKVIYARPEELPKLEPVREVRK